jgi:hypothetical protein
MMNWKECNRKRRWSNLTFLPSIYLEGLRKSTKSLVRIAGLRDEIEPGTSRIRSRSDSTTTLGDRVRRQWHVWPYDHDPGNVKNVVLCPAVPWQRSGALKKLDNFRKFVSTQFSGFASRHINIIEEEFKILKLGDCLSCHGIRTEFHECHLIWR